MLAALAILIALAVGLSCLAGILRINDIVVTLTAIHAELRQIRGELERIHEDALERDGRG